MKRFMGYVFILTGIGIIVIGFPFVILVASMSLAYNPAVLRILISAAGALLLVSAVGSSFIQRGIAWKDAKPTPDIGATFRIGSLPFRMLTGTAIWSCFMIAAFLIPGINAPWRLGLPVLFLAAFTETVIHRLLVKRFSRK